MNVANMNRGHAVLTRLSFRATALVLAVCPFGATIAACPTKTTPLTTSALELVADCGPVPWDGWLLSREAYAQIRADLAGERVRATEAESDLSVAWATVAGALALGVAGGFALGLR